jgi:hypothetical protein
MTNWSSTVPLGRVATTDTYDGAAHGVVQTADDDLVLVYTENDNHHHSPDGRIVARRSSNRGATWSDRTYLHNPSARDVTSPSVIDLAGSDRILVFDVSFAVEEPADHTTNPARWAYDTHLIESPDGGRTWNDPASITDRFSNEQVIPFGGVAETSNGLLTAFYSHQWDIEILLSEDGKTWSDSRTIATPPPDRKFCEPVPCAVTREKTLVFCRDNATGDFCALKSADGGTTWSDPVYFNPTNSPSPKPLWAKKTGPNELTALWGDRDDGYIYAVSMSAHLAWQDPTEIDREPRYRLHKQVGDADAASYWDGTAGDFGYPTFVKLGPTKSDVFVTFYDESPRPNLWYQTLR